MANTNNKSINSVKIIPLGGLGEVGKNACAIEYKNEIIIIDFGGKFPDETLPGVELIVPAIDFLQENKEKIKALIITHGHEDHIGSVPFLLSKINDIDVYIPPLGERLLKNKLKEHKINAKQLNLIGVDSNLKFGNFKIEFFNQTHSIPDTYGVIINTPIGNIVHTGDFKVDFSPPTQGLPDFSKMAKVGEEGVLCLLSDSTNSEREGFTKSESEIGNSLKTIIKSNRDKRIICSTFASNLQRIQQIVEGALEEDRFIFVIGRSMKNNFQAAQTLGYFKIPNKKLVNIKDVNKYEDHQVLIVCTGSQGEELAALSRMSNDLNKDVKLTKNDLIVFASNPIPGNNYAVNKLIDGLLKKEVEVITNGNTLTHTSGHAAQEEQKLLLSLFKPKFFMPAHGEHRMLSTHASTAQKLGVPKENCFILENGDCLEITKNTGKITRNFTNGDDLFIDTKKNIIKSSVLNEKTKFLKHGILIISFVLNKKGEFVVSPKITSKGFIYVADSLPLIKSIRKNTMSGINYYFKSNDVNNHNKNEFEQYISNSIKNFVKKETSKEPMVLITYSVLDKKAQTYTRKK